GAFRCRAPFEARDRSRPQRKRHRDEFLHVATGRGGNRGRPSRGSLPRASGVGVPARSSEGETSTRRPAGATRVRWLLIFWLFVLSGVGYLDRVNISVAGGTIADAYSLSSVQLGWIFSAFLVGYALFQTPGGWLADRVGSRRVLSAGVLWWGIFTALVAAVPAGAAH